MKDVFAKLGTDFLSAIVFLVLYLTTGNVVLATSRGDRRRRGPGHPRPRQGTGRSAS